MIMISEILSYPFLMRAFFTGLLVSLTASLIGVSLTLRRYAMIGDGLSHVGFGSLGVAALLSIAPMALTVPTVVIASIVLLLISERKKDGGDSAIALISSSALAIGVIAVSMGGVNTDLNSFLFGSILSVSKSDALLSVILSIVALFSYVVFYHQIYATTFDPVFSKATGIKVERYTLLLSILTALSVVIGMRILGSLLISAIIIFPAKIAIKLAKTYKRVTIVSAIESLIAFTLGFIISYALSLPTGASIVVTHLALLLIAMAVKAIQNRFRS